MFLYYVERIVVRIAERRVPFFKCKYSSTEVESLADDWVGTRVCKLLSSLCCYDWLSISVVLSIRVCKNTYLFDIGFYCLFIIFDCWLEFERKEFDERGIKRRLPLRFRSQAYEH